MDEQKLSPALQMIRLCYDAGVVSTGLDRWKQRMHRAIQCAILGGLRFQEGDIEALRQWRNRAWLCAEGMETHYSAAIARGRRSSRDEPNVSAARAIEFYLGRKPFMYMGARVAIGTEVELEGVRWEVSGFRDDIRSINLNQSLWGRPNVRRRLSLDEWRAIEKARKEAAKPAPVTEKSEEGSEPSA